MRINIFLFLVLTLTGCSTKPQPIKFGIDECAACKMTIMDKKFGAELITIKGKIHKFDDVICMIEFINNSEISEDLISQKLIIDYLHEAVFIDAEKAIYYLGEDVHSPMNGNAAAFKDKQDAIQFQNGKKGIIGDWEKVYQQLN